jgi:PBSX family phage terminase large subunit
MTTEACTIELILPPHEQQRKFINAAQLEQLYGGAKRGGKSVALAMKIALLSLQFPGNRGLLARKDFTDLRDSTLTTFFQVLPSELILDWNKSERLIQIKTGAQPSQVLYRGLGDVHEVEKSKGIDLGWLAIDEPSEIDEATYLMLRAQLTWVLPNGTRPPYMCLLASNPEPGWVKRRFITNPAPGTIFIPSLPRDNPGLPAGWEGDLRNSYPPDWINKYLEGSWDVAEGQVFTEFDRQTHIVDRINPAHMKLAAAIDHATTGTTCMVIVGLDSSGNINVLAEYYRQNALVSQHAAAMQKLMAEFGGKKRFDYILIDPSTESKTQQGVYELYSEPSEATRHAES